jgi:hypothetical protein
MNVLKLKPLVKSPEWAALEEYLQEVYRQGLADLEEAVPHPEALEVRGRVRLARHLLDLPRLLNEDVGVDATQPPVYYDDGM